MTNTKYILFSNNFHNNNYNSYNACQIINFFTSNKTKLYYLPIFTDYTEHHHSYLEEKYNDYIVKYEKFEDMKELIFDSNSKIILQSDLIHITEILNYLKEKFTIDINIFENKFITFLNLYTDNESLQLVRLANHISQHIIVNNEYYKTKYKNHFTKPVHIYNSFMNNFNIENMQYDEKILKVKETDNIIITNINEFGYVYTDKVIKIFFKLCLDMYNNKEDLTKIKLLILCNNLEYDIEQILQNEIETQKYCQNQLIPDEFINQINKTLIIIGNQRMLSTIQLHTIYYITDIYLNINKYCGTYHHDIMFNQYNKIVVYPYISSYQKNILFNSDYAYMAATDIIDVYNNPYNNSNKQLNSGGKLYIYKNEDIYNILVKAIKDIKNNNIINNKEIIKFMKNYNNSVELNWVFQQCDIKLSSNSGSINAVASIYDENKQITVASIAEDIAADTKIKKEDSTTLVTNNIQNDTNSLYYANLNTNQQSTLTDMNKLSKEQLIAELMKYKSLAVN